MIPSRPGPEADLRTLLLRAAREILSEPDTPLELRKVAERAGKSRTAPYLAFGKTEEGGGLAALRLAVSAEAIEELAGAMESARASHRDPEEGLEAMAAAYLAFAMRHPRRFRLAFGPEVATALRTTASSAEAKRERNAVRTARQRLEGVILDAIESQAPGYLRDQPAAGPRVLSAAVWAILHGVAMLSLDDQWELTGLPDGETPEELAKKTLRFLTFASSDALRGPAGALARAVAARSPSRSLDRSADGSLSRSPEPAADLSVGEREFEGLIAESSAAPDASPRERSAAEAHGTTPLRREARRSRPPPGPAPPVLRRVRTQLPLVQGSRVLWVDDHPRRIRHERAVLEGLGAEVAMARSTAEAAEALDGEPFDLIISDIDRAGDPAAGIRALGPLRELGRGIPLVLYVHRLDRDRPSPEGAFGLTNDPEELLHLVLDALGRVR